VSRGRSFMERERVREERERNQRDLRHSDKASMADGIMREYEDAYKAANGEPIHLHYTSGWVRSTKLASPYRLSELPTLTKNLWARVHEQEITDEH
jgi:hypothetical protein